RGRRHPHRRPRRDAADARRALRPLPGHRGAGHRGAGHRAGGRPMSTILVIAEKEIREGLRNRWVLATTLLLATLALSLTFLGSAPTGNVGASALDVVIVSLSSLSVFLVPLIALLISHDAVVGEMERG